MKVIKTMMTGRALALCLFVVAVMMPTLVVSDDPTDSHSRASSSLRQTSTTTIKGSEAAAAETAATSTTATSRQVLSNQENVEQWLEEGGEDDEESHQPKSQRKASSSSSFSVDQVYPGISYADASFFSNNRTLSPPDPTCGVSKTTLVAAVNGVVQIRNKQDGSLLFASSYETFFDALGPSGLLYDPKIVYDQYEDRFIFLVLQLANPGSGGNQAGENDSPQLPQPPQNRRRYRHLQTTLSTNVTGDSNLYVAVSTSGSPVSDKDWFLQSIKSLEPNPSGGGDYLWADYPGVEISQEALYITANMFSFDDTVGFAGVRLWIVGKTSFYSGGTISYTRNEPYGSQLYFTAMPALVYGGPIGNNIGTFLVVTDTDNSGNNVIHVTSVIDPLGTPSFTSQNVTLGVVDDFSSELLNAPQLTSSVEIQVNDRRALDAAWRDNSLWLTTEILSISGANAGQTTAYWIKISTNTFLVEDQGEIGGEDIGIGTYTSFPSVAVNAQGVAAFGFAASGPAIHAGAYVVGRNPSDPPGTVSSSFVVHSGMDVYDNVVGGRNRWGDYTGIGVDPVDQSFWVFNQYADLSSVRGFGRWNTAWAHFLSASSTVTSSPSSLPTASPVSVAPTASPVTPVTPPTASPVAPVKKPTAPVRKPTPTKPVAKPNIFVINTKKAKVTKKKIGKHGGIGGRRRRR